jgi:hypothetical protein
MFYRLTIIVRQFRVLLFSALKGVLYKIDKFTQNYTARFTSEITEN